MIFYAARSPELPVQGFLLSSTEISLAYPVSYIIFPPAASSITLPILAGFPRLSHIGVNYLAPVICIRKPHTLLKSNKIIPSHYFFVIGAMLRIEAFAPGVCPHLFSVLAQLYGIIVTSFS